MRIAILGATGLVGCELLDLLARAWPMAELTLYASKGQELRRQGVSYPVLAATALEADDAPSGDLAFVALDDAHSARYVPRLLDLGYKVVDKSNAYRADPSVPLVVAGVNCQLAESARLVANPNCTTIPLAMCLAVLHRLWGIEDVAVSTYQAISGAGKAVLAEFVAGAARGYAGLAAADDLLGAALPAADYVGNTVPHNGGTDASGFSAEERKLMNETRKILGLDDLLISAQCCRVPVAVGHYENLWLRLADDAPLGDVAAALDGAAARWIEFVPGAQGDGLSALATLRHRDRALVGRLRRDPRDRTGRSICLTIAADNLRLGAATNAVRVASRWFPAMDSDLRCAV